MFFFRFGYIEYEDISTATAAQKKANGKEIMGRNIRVNFAKARDGGGQACGRGSGGSRGSGRGVIRGGYFRRGGRGGRAQGKGQVVVELFLFESLLDFSVSSSEMCN